MKMRILGTIFVLLVVVAYVLLSGDLSQVPQSPSSQEDIPASGSSDAEFKNLKIN